jgi:hypothetical protein
VVARLESAPWRPSAAALVKSFVFEARIRLPVGRHENRTSSDSESIT